MPQTAGKPKTKSSSTSKRHFTVVIGTKEHGLYCSSSPSSAARKAVSKLCGKKVKNVEFCLREITQGSKKKTYGPYLGHVEKLAKPIELKGRVIRFDIKVHFFKTFLLPHFDYCASLFIYFSNTLINKLKKLYNLCLFVLLRLELKIFPVKINKFYSNL